MFVTSEGRPGARLQRTLAARNLTAAEQAAFEIAARELVELYAEKGGPKYERAALEYLTRSMAEGNPSLADVAQIAAVLAERGLLMRGLWTRPPTQLVRSRRTGGGDAAPDCGQLTQSCPIRPRRPHVRWPMRARCRRTSRHQGGTCVVHLGRGYLAAHPCRRRGLRRARDRCARDSCPSVRVLSRSVSSSVRTSGASAKTCDVRHPWPCPIERDRYRFPQDAGLIVEEAVDESQRVVDVHAVRVRHALAAIGAQRVDRQDRVGARKEIRPARVAEA